MYEGTEVWRDGRGVVGGTGGSPGPDFCPRALAWDSCSDTSVAWKAEASPGGGRHQVAPQFKMLSSRLDCGPV